MFSLPKQRREHEMKDIPSEAEELQRRNRELSILNTIARELNKATASLR